MLFLTFQTTLQKRWEFHSTDMGNQPRDSHQMKRAARWQNQVSLTPDLRGSMLL